VGDLYNPCKARERDGGKRSRLGRVQNSRREGELGFGSRDLYLAKVIIGKISPRANVSIGSFFFSFSFFFLFFPPFILFSFPYFFFFFSFSSRVAQVHVSFR